MALDHGEARCGVAISDPTGTLATPVGAVARPDTRRGRAEIVRLAREREVGRVVAVSYTHLTLPTTPYV